MSIYNNIIFNFKSQNFVSKPKGKDSVIRIYDKNNKPKYSINPEKMYFYYKNRFLFIRQDGMNNVTLDFENENEAILALKKLNEIKNFFVDTTGSSDYFTKDQLNNGILDSRYLNSGETENRYVNVSGDNMSGNLSILTLSGDTITNMNISEVGTLIKGNQNLIRKTVDGTITPINFIDSFKKDLDFSVFWEYAVKNNTNIRAGVIVAAWNDINNEIVFTHYSTMDLGDTSDIDMYVDMDNSNNYLRLKVSCTLIWNIKVLRRFI